MLDHDKHKHTHNHDKHKHKHNHDDKDKHKDKDNRAPPRPPPPPPNGDREGSKRVAPPQLPWRVALRVAHDSEVGGVLRTVDTCSVSRTELGNDGDDGTTSHHHSDVVTAVIALRVVVVVVVAHDCLGLASGIWLGGPRRVTVE